MTHATAPTPISAHAHGIVRGREIDGDATVTIDHAGVTLGWRDAAAWIIDLAGLDGFAASPHGLTLYLGSGDVLELRGQEVATEGTQRLAAVVYAMPELTRGLRSLGSLRGAPGPAHDRWFAPLLAARRAVEGVTDPARQLASFDAPHLGRELQRAIDEIAAIGAPEGGAAQRALAAALEEEAEPVEAALTRLAERAVHVTEAPTDATLVAWRRWVDGVRQVFAAADESWPRCAEVLRD